MARGKKKESTLTPEEKLAQALVPDWEQPYKVPKNWCWVRGVAIFKEMETRKPKGEFFDYIDIDAIDNSLQVVTAPKHMAVKDAPSRASRAVHYGDTVFSLVRPYLKNIAFIDESLQDCIASTGFYVCSPSYVVIPRYLYLLMISSYVVDGLNKYMKGDNSPSIRKDDIELFAYPVPPRAEQQRIIDRIEYLFTKLDEAKEKAQTVLDSFETRKAAILHKAFIGELTAKWRAEHGVGMTCWNSTTLAQVVSGFKYGTSEKSDYNNTGMPVLRIPNVGDGYVDFSDMKYLNHSDVDEESQIHEGDILIIRSNGSRDLVGKSVLVPKLDRPHAYASFLIRIKPSAIVKADYLTLYLNSADARTQMFRKAKSSAGINNINSKELGAISLMLPSISEQMEIVRILDSLFAKEQQAKEAAEAVLEKINLLKKSILARAFRGELGTNDPTEESALELLKQILKEDVPVEPKKRSKSIPKELQAKFSIELERKIVKLYFKHETDSLPAEELLSVSSKKFEVMETLRALEQRKLIKKLPNGNYRLLE